MNEYASIAVAILGSGGFTALVTALISANQRRKDRNDDISKKLDGIEKKLDDHIAENEMQFMLQDRARIIAFADECRRKIQHSAEAFDDISRSIDEYQTYCDNHKSFKNSKAEVSIAVIKDAQTSCLKDDKYV